MYASMLIHICCQEVTSFTLNFSDSTWARLWNPVRWSWSLVVVTPAAKPSLSRTMMMEPLRNPTDMLLWLESRGTPGKSQPKWVKRSWWSAPRLSHLWRWECVGQKLCCGTSLRSTVGTNVHSLYRRGIGSEWVIGVSEYYTSALDPIAMTFYYLIVDQSVAN